MKKFFLIITSGFLMISFSCDNYFDDMEMQKKLTEGLVGYWPITENYDSLNVGSKYIKDYSSNKNNFLLISSNTSLPYNVKGKFSTGLSFNTGISTDGHAYTSCNDLLKGSNEFSIAFWYNANGFVNDNISIIYGDGFNVFSNLSTIGITINNGPSVSTKELADEGWLHISIIYDRKKISIYTNSILDDHYSYNGAIPMVSELYLACDGTTGDYYCGVLDEIRIYNRALSEEEVKALMEIGVE